MTGPASPEGPRDLIERACEVMHDAYEAAAVGAGWETQGASRKPWADVPEANRATMRAAVAALLVWLHRSPEGPDERLCLSVYVDPVAGETRCQEPRDHGGEVHRSEDGEWPVASCTCGSISLYAERPPRYGPHHHLACPRYVTWRSPEGPDEADALYAEAVEMRRERDEARDRADRLARVVAAVHDRVMHARLAVDDGYRNEAERALIDVSDMLRNPEATP